MNKQLLHHYQQYSQYTNPGLYEEYLKSLPDDIREVGLLIRKNIVHRTTLRYGNKWTNADLKYGDMTKVPWWRQPEDDNFVTAAAILAELFRRDSRGLTMERKVEDKMILTCRYISVLMASYLKAKGIPARVRSGFADYFEGEHVAWDHWINQYWDKEENGWVIIDVDGSLHRTGYDMYDLQEGEFIWAANAWLTVREGKQPGAYFHNGSGYKGLITIGWALFNDFHCLMNNEKAYLHQPEILMLSKFRKSSEESLQEIDSLARLLQEPDKNVEQLLHIWNTEKKFRLLKGGLL